MITQCSKKISNFCLKTCKPLYILPKVDVNFMQNHVISIPLLLEILPRISEIVAHILSFIWKSRLCSDMLLWNNSDLLLEISAGEMCG